MQPDQTHFNIQSVWFGVLSIKDKVCLMRVVKTASKVIGPPEIPLGDV